jgi:cobalamin biosynthesis Mg chelatase CobN
VLALLALVLFPVLAQADGAGVIYGEAPPTVPGKKSTDHETETRAHSSDTGGATAPSGTNGSGPGGSGGSGGEVSGGGSSEGSANTNPSTGGSQSGGQAGNGKQPTGSHGDASVQSGKPVSSSSAADDSSSSSPLVPILIAIAVLAAISIGAVVIKQRRQRDAGGQVSPKAS